MIRVVGVMFAWAAGLSVGYGTWAVTNAHVGEGLFWIVVVNGLCTVIGCLLIERSIDD